LWPIAHSQLLWQIKFTAWQTGHYTPALLPKYQEAQYQVTTEKHDENP